MTKIAPSILGADFWQIGRQIRLLEEAGADYLHLDIMDGAYVPNISFGPAFVKALRPHSALFFDAHLMIDEPGRFVRNFAEAGADLITVHYEACHHLHRTVQEIKEAGVKAGVSLNPATPVEQLVEILPELDLVLIMSVNPGFGGQQFIPLALDKIVRLKKMICGRGLNVEIEVDGGVSTSNAAAIVSAGADILVAGAALFKAPDLAIALQELKKAASGQF